MAIIKRIVYFYSVSLCVSPIHEKPDNNRTLSLPTIDLSLIISSISTNFAIQHTKHIAKQLHMLFRFRNEAAWSVLLLLLLFRTTNNKPFGTNTVWRSHTNDKKNIVFSLLLFGVFPTHNPTGMGIVNNVASFPARKLSVSLCVLTEEN